MSTKSFDMISILVDIIECTYTPSNVTSVALNQHHVIPHVCDTSLIIYSTSSLDDHTCITSIRIL